MNVQIKLFATFRRYLPPGTQGSAVEVEVPAGTPVSQVLSQFEIPDQESFVILVNGRGADPEQVLNEGDAIAVFPAMAGG
jgi:molybdopterin converting factor small subunit